MTSLEIFARSWFPVARGEEVVPRHVVQTAILGQEIAVWRDDPGAVNAWENRCPHRGVRLSIGLNTGNELRCQYHGWRYASGTGQCTFIPAHPDQKPPSVIRAKPYGVAERHGFVWASLAGESSSPAIPALGIETGTTLRSLFFDAPVSRVADALTAGWHFAEEPNDPQSPLVDAKFTRTDEFVFRATVGAAELVMLLQPVDSARTVLHSVAAPMLADAQRLRILRGYNAQLSELRDRVERAAA